MKSIMKGLWSINNIRALLIVTFVFTTKCSVAQSNLIMNPSFEQYFDTSILGVAAFLRGYVSGWSDPNTGSSDLYAPNDYPSSTCPPIHHSGFEFPHKGYCYAGLVFYESAPFTFHEYVQASFRSPLIAGQSYGIESYVSLAWEGQSLCASDLGFYFSDSQMHVDTSPFGERINVIPQYENPPSNMITTYNGWQRITGTYTAHGGESYLSIGNFRADSMAHVDTCGSSLFAIYLLIDDVAVYDTSLVDTIHLCLNDSIQIGGNWRHEPGNYFDTIGGLPIKYYIKLRPFSASLTLLTRPFEYGDSIKLSLLQKEGSDSSYEIGLHNYIFIKNDTIIDVPMFNIYGCDSTVRYICGWHIGISNQISHKLVWSIYPNPANDFLYITLNENDPNSYFISIMDITGKEIISRSVSKESVDISSLTSGMYFVKLLNSKTGKLLGTEKFVKE